MSRKFVSALIVCAVLQAACGAATIVWGNNASSSRDILEAFDLSTGNVVAQFQAPNPLAANGNGRGIAVVGSTIYYSTASSGNVFVTDSNTHADLGIAFNTGLNGIANIAWDGTALWITGYNGTNNAFRYTPSGTLLQTVVGFGNNRDGFEVVNNGLIANRGDGEGPYDLYSSTGTLVQSAFLDTTKVPNLRGITTGVTFDGTDYIVSNPDSFSGPTTRFLIFDSSGHYLSTLALGNPQPNTGIGRLIEDLSALGNIPSNPPPSVPEPASMALLSVGLCAIAFRGIRRARLDR